MARLSDRQLAAILEEIAAAMHVDMPITEAMQRLCDLRLGRVGKAASQFADSMNAGQSPAEAIRVVNSPVIEQVSAAIRASHDSDDPELLLRLARLLRARAECSRVSRLAWLYPLILLIIAYGTLVAAMVPMLRAYQGNDFSWPGPVLALSGWLETNWHWPPLVFAALMFGYWLWRRGYAAVPRDARVRMFCQSLVDQIESDIPESEAIHTAANLSGQTSLTVESNLTLKSPQVSALLANADESLLQVPGASEQETVLARLKYVAAIHDERARRHDYLWSRLYPRVAMVVIGGGFTVGYACWVIAPVYLQVGKW